ncbi:MAG: TMEM165/GDT1 family protein [Bdellovibrio bacteriovorus]
MDLITTSLSGWPAVGLATFGVVLLAEMGDKSQLVCMTLAARHRSGPVLAGAAAAFLLLNTLAVTVGAALAQWIPERLLAGGVALLFGAYGLLALRNSQDTEGEEAVVERGARGVFASTFLLLLVAEMGDKTQLAVAGMAGTLPPVPVWLGATLALLTTSALGVLVGCKLLRLLPIRRLHQVSGAFFLTLAAAAAVRALALA